MAYRDALEAAQRRITLLERELGELRSRDEDRAVSEADRVKRLTKRNRALLAELQAAQAERRRLEMSLVGLKRERLATDSRTELAELQRRRMELERECGTLRGHLWRERELRVERERELQEAVELAEAERDRSDRALRGLKAELQGALAELAERREEAVPATSGSDLEGEEREPVMLARIAELERRLADSQQQVVEELNRLDARADAVRARERAIGDLEMQARRAALLASQMEQLQRERDRAVERANEAEDRLVQRIEEMGIERAELEGRARKAELLLDEVRQELPELKRRRQERAEEFEARGRRGSTSAKVVAGASAVIVGVLGALAWLF